MYVVISTSPDGWTLCRPAVGGPAFMILDPPWPVEAPEILDPPWPDGYEWPDPYAVPADIHPDAPEGYGTTWGPLGRRYVMQPRRAEKPPRREVSAVLVANSTEIPPGALPRSAARIADQAAAAGRLGAVTYAMAELEPTALHPDGRLRETLVVRWTPARGRPAGFACWVDGQFDRAMTGDMRRIPARGISAELAFDESSTSA